MWLQLRPKKRWSIEHIRQGRQCSCVRYELKPKQQMNIERTIHSSTDGSTAVNEADTWFAVIMNERQMKWAEKYGVSIMASHIVAGKWQIEVILRLLTVKCYRLFCRCDIPIVRVEDAVVRS